MTDIQAGPIAPVRKIISASPKEHLLNLLKAALATAPFAGGIASLMTEYIPSMKQKRLEEFVSTIGEDLTTLQERVEESIFQTDEFAFLFEKCFRGIAENYQTEKLDAFRGILVNAAIGSDLASDERDYYICLVNSLSALHLRMLSFMSDPEIYLAAAGIPADRISGGFSRFFPIAIPGVELEILKGAFEDLYQAGLINTDKSMFSMTTAGSGLNLLGDRVSGLGKRFVNFCTSPAI